MGGSGPIQTGGEIVSLAYNADAILAAVTAEVSVIPILNVIMFALDILELAGIIPNPISLLIQAFTGRPRSQASLEQAGRLMNARNPAARQAGIMLERMVSEWNLVTSEAGSGRTIVNAWASLFVSNLTAQGVPLDRARQILVNATSEAAQTGLPLEPELRTPLAQGLVFNAEASTLQVLTQQYQAQIAKGATINNALKAAEQYLFKNYGLTHLFKLQIGKYIPPATPPSQLIPGQDGVCPSGYSLDPTSEMCVYQPPGGQGGGGGGEVPPGGSGPGGGDEVTDLCECMDANNAALIAALQGLDFSGAPQDDACCQNIVSAIANVATALTSILTVVSGISGTNPTSVDLSGVVGELTALVGAVQNLAPSGAIDFSPIVNALNEISAKIPPTSGADVAGIQKALETIAAQGDVDQPTLDALQAGGLINSGDLQTLQGIKWSDALSYLMASSPVRAVERFITRVAADADTIAGEIAGPVGSAANWAESTIIKALTTERNAIQGVLEPVLEAVIRALSPPGPTSPGAIGVKPDTVLADVAAVALNLKGLATLIGLFREGAAEQLEHITEVITGFLGFEELREVQIGPLVENGIAAVAEISARNTFRQTLPGAGELTGWFARGLIEQAQERATLGFHGFDNQWMPMQEAAAFGGLQARVLIRLSASGLFSAQDLRDELTFSGMRPASQTRFLAAAPWLAVQSERNQLKATLEQAYVQGFFTDADLTQQLDQANQNVDRDALVLARVQLQKRIAFAKKLEAAYRKQFAANVITDVQYISLLEGLGLQTDWVNNQVAEDEAIMLATLARQAAAAERALERATAAEERRAAVKNYTSGNIDAAALSAALLLTGLTPAQAAAWVDLAVLQKAGGLRWTYGLQLPPAESALLKARVTALSDQRKRLEISDPEFVAALHALNIPQNFINTIRAAADAMITPKTAAVIIPVTTS